MKRITWLVILGSAALAGCGGSVVMPGGSSGSGGGAGTSGSGGSGGGSACCRSDRDCSDMECISGDCLLPETQGCWRDSDCGPNERCVGVQVCACGDMCGPDRNFQGACEPTLGCCSSDADCNPDQECVSGMCKQKPPQDQCWRNSDCPFGDCTNAYVCPCRAGSTCTHAMDVLGRCPMPKESHPQ